jgi:glutaminyl-tRNA synthetase
MRVVIENYPEGQAEAVELVNNPEDSSAGVRRVPFSRVLYIEQDDFREQPPPRFHRLAPGREVRLRGTYFIKCERVVKDADGNITELRCTHGAAPDGRKVKATIHWVSAAHAVEAEVRLYDRLFTVANPADDKEGRDYKEFLNPDSLQVLTSCKVEPSLAEAMPGDRFQFERLGYFAVDPDSTPARLVFDRTVTLRDTWARIEQAQKRGG